MNRAIQFKGGVAAAYRDDDQPLGLEWTPNLSNGEGRAAFKKELIGTGLVTEDEANKMLGDFLIGLRSARELVALSHEPH